MNGLIVLAVWIVLVVVAVWLLYSRKDNQDPHTRVRKLEAALADIRLSAKAYGEMAALDSEAPAYVAVGFDDIYRAANTALTSKAEPKRKG